METTDLDQLKTDTHKIYHKFSNWLVNTFGKDLNVWREMEFDIMESSKVKKIRYREVNEFELSKRLVGYNVISKIEKYVKRYCPEIKIVSCDDEVYAGSIIILIPHPKHGITVMFIPQCTSIQNQFFLYGNHYRQLVTTLQEMDTVYQGSDDF